MAMETRHRTDVDGTLRPRFMIGRYLDALWYGTPLHGPLLAAKQTSFQLHKTRIRVFSPTSFIRRKAPATALRVLSDYVARVYMNILFLTLNGSMGFFFSSFAATCYFFISLFLSRRLDRSVVPYSRSLIQRDQDLKV
jgi:hypothetical protein